MRFLNQEELAPRDISPKAHPARGGALRMRNLCTCVGSRSRTRQAEQQPVYHSFTHPCELAEDQKHGDEGKGQIGCEEGLKTGTRERRRRAAQRRHGANPYYDWRRNSLLPLVATATTL